MEHAMREAAEAKAKPKKTKTKPFIETLINQEVEVLDDNAEPMYHKKGEKIILVELDEKRRLYVFKKESGRMFAVHYDKIGGIGTLSESPI